MTVRFEEATKKFSKNRQRQQQQVSVTFHKRGPAVSPWCRPGALYQSRASRERIVLHLHGMISNTQALTRGIVTDQTLAPASSRGMSQGGIVLAAPPPSHSAVRRRGMQDSSAAAQPADKVPIQARALSVTAAQYSAS